MSHAQEIFEWNYEGDIQTFDDSMSNGAWHHESCKSPKAHCRWIGCWMFDHHSVATLENACLCEARLEIQQILVGVVWTFGWAWDFPYWEILKYYCHDRDHWILVIEVLFLYWTFTVTVSSSSPQTSSIYHPFPPTSIIQVLWSHFSGSLEHVPLGHLRWLWMSSFGKLHSTSAIGKRSCTPNLQEKSLSRIGTVGRFSILNHEEVACTWMHRVYRADTCL